MKKIYFLAMLLCAGFAFTSCDDENEDEKIATVTFEGTAFDALIDSPQYNGPLIYSGNEYTWTDAATTLTGSVAKADWTAWGYGYGWANGFAISNYIDAAESASYDKQLAVPETNGSKNFAVCYDDGSKIAFADGVARVIRSIQVSPTTYVLRNVQKNCAEGYEFKAIATGTKVDGTTATVDIVLAKGTEVQTTWQVVDLKSLGAVTEVAFTFDGTDKGNYGLSTPKYIAIDNVVVEL